MPVATTYVPSNHASCARELAVLPSLREREFDGVCDALADGQLVALVLSGSEHEVCFSEIVGALTPEYADALVSLTEEKPARDKRAEKLGTELQSLRAELTTLREIVREVMAEKCPQDFTHRIGGCVDDAEGILKDAIEMAEEL